MKELKNLSRFSESETPNGIFLTHAHIGHYTGLMYLGREALNAKKVPIYAMPRMKNFLETNGPWSQLVKLKNIQLKELEENVSLGLSSSFTVNTFRVPHRDEFSETVGYHIKGLNKSALFIPDIDKWEKWDKNISEEIKKVDYAFIDATFYSGEEINTRNIKEIPHPFVIETITLFKSLSTEQRAKIYFIHFNHTNPLLIMNSKESVEALKDGYHIAAKGQTFSL
jgi:pyrroloquinoline quinone biosynthesis protein B